MTMTRRELLGMALSALVAAKAVPDDTIRINGVPVDFIPPWGDDPGKPATIDNVNLDDWIQR